VRAVTAARRCAKLLGPLSQLLGRRLTEAASQVDCNRRYGVKDSRHVSVRRSKNKPATVGVAIDLTPLDYVPGCFWNVPGEAAVSGRTTCNGSMIIAEANYRTREGEVTNTQGHSPQGKHPKEPAEPVAGTF
jgi:hypothetical protein